MTHNCSCMNTLFSSQPQFIPCPPSASLPYHVLGKCPCRFRSIRVKEKELVLLRSLPASDFLELQKIRTQTSARCFLDNVLSTAKCPLLGSLDCAGWAGPCSARGERTRRRRVETNIEVPCCDRVGDPS